MFLIQVAGRRTILVFGYSIMSVFLFLCGLSVFQGWNLEAFIKLCLFIGTFEFS